MKAHLQGKTDVTEILQILLLLLLLSPELELRGKHDLMRNMQANLTFLLVLT